MAWFIPEALSLQADVLRAAGELILWLRASAQAVKSPFSYYFFLTSPVISLDPCLFLTFCLAPSHQVSSVEELLAAPASSQFFLALPERGGGCWKHGDLTDCCVRNLGWQSRLQLSLGRCYSAIAFCFKLTTVQAT